jgi:hypothetical protein
MMSLLLLTAIVAVRVSQPAPAAQPAQAAPEATMTRVERAELIDRLVQTEKEFLQAPC